MGLKIEVCGSCLRGCDLVKTPEEKLHFAAQLESDLRANHSLDCQIEVGQCQRFCPDQRVTLSFSKNPDGSDRRLGASPQGTYASICEFIVSRAPTFLAK